MARIFISHSGQDATNCDPVGHHLEKRGYSPLFVHRHLRENNRVGSPDCARPDISPFAGEPRDKDSLHLDQDLTRVGAEAEALEPNSDHTPFPGSSAFTRANAASTSAATARPVRCVHCCAGSAVAGARPTSGGIA